MIKRIWLALLGNKFARARLFSSKRHTPHIPPSAVDDETVDKLRKAGL